VAVRTHVHAAGQRPKIRTGKARTGAFEEAIVRQRRRVRIPGGGWLAAGFFLAVTAAAPEHSRAGLIGGAAPFAINQVTAGEQAVPRAAVTASGRSMVVWDSASDGDDLGILGRVYDSSGAPLGGEFAINTYTAGAQFGPVIGALGSGGFVVVWESYDFAGGPDILFGRRFSADGSPLGSEFRVDISISELHAQPDLAAQAGGGFVVVWDDYTDVFALRLDSGGAAIGSEFRVNASDGSMSDARVAAAFDGSFVVTWTDGSEIDGDGDGILARRFDSDGTADGGDLQVNSTANGDQYNSAVARSPAGDFTIVWETYGQTDAGDGLFARRFAADGSELGTQFRVDAGNSVYAGGGAVAANEEGEFVVVWNEPRSGDGYIYSVMARRIEADGALGETVLDIGADSDADQSQANVVADGDSGFLVVWREELDEGDIFGQRVALPPGTPGPGCDGDCDGNRVVSVAELITAVNISLETAELSRCPAADANDNGVVSINELILAVNSALDGC
jgi:hypothetical protein